MDNTQKKRSVCISGHQTSITLEEPFWQVLREIAAQEKISVNQLISEIDQNNNKGNLSSSIRIYILQNLQEKLAQQSI